METHSLLESTRTCLAFGRQSLVYQAVAHTARYGLAELVASYSPSTDRIPPAHKHGWLPLLVLFWQRPCVPVIIELTNFSENLREHEFGYWLHPSRRTADHLHTWREWRPSPCPSDDARPQRIKKIFQTRPATVVTVTSRISP